MQQASKGRQARWAGALLMGGMDLWLLATFGGWMPGGEHLWAFSFLTYVPFALRILMMGGVVAAAVGIALAPVGENEGNQRSRSARVGLWVWLVLAAAIFWFGRERTWHGDALLKLDLLATESLQSDPYVWKEPLDSLLAYTTTAALGAYGLAPEVAIALLSIAAGLLYVWAVWLLVRWIPDEREEGRRGWQAAWAVGLLAVGSSLLWFGHVENYSWSTAMTMAAAALAVGYVQGQAPLWAVGLASGLAVSFHPQAAFALPALFVLLRRREWPRQATTLAVAGLVGPLITAALLLWLGASPPDFRLGYAGDRQLFWTLAQALEPARLLEAVDNLWLVAPLYPLWLAAGFWAWTQPQVRRSRVFRYLTALAAGLLFYHFAFQNDLARQRDWDLFAIVGPVVTLWGLAACRLLWLEGAPPLRRGIEGVLAPGLAFAACYSLAWVGVNHAYTLIRPNPDQRELYARFRVLDLTESLGNAQVTPSMPICDGPENCARVAATTFVMPQDGDERSTLFAHAPAEVAFTLAVPEERSFLWFSPALDPAAWGWGGDGVTFQVSVVAGGQETILWSRHLSPDLPGDRDWQEVMLALDDFRGQTVGLKLATLPGPMNNDAADRAGWGLPWLMRGTPDRRFDE